MRRNIRRLDDEVWEIIAQAFRLPIINVIVCWTIFLRDFCRSCGRVRLSHADDHDDEEQEEAIEQRLGAAICRLRQWTFFLFSLDFYSVMIAFLCVVE